MKSQNEQKPAFSWYFARRWTPRNTKQKSFESCGNPTTQNHRCCWIWRVRPFHVKIIELTSWVLILLKTGNWNPYPLHLSATQCKEQRTSFCHSYIVWRDLFSPFFFLTLTLFFTLHLHRNCKTWKYICMHVFLFTPGTFLWPWVFFLASPDLHTYSCLYCLQRVFIASQSLFACNFWSCEDRNHIRQKSLETCQTVGAGNWRFVHHRQVCLRQCMIFCFKFVLVNFLTLLNGYVVSLGGKEEIKNCGTLFSGTLSPVINWATLDSLIRHWSWTIGTKTCSWGQSIPFLLLTFLTSTICKFSLFSAARLKKKIELNSFPKKKKIISFNSREQAAFFCHQQGRKWLCPRFWDDTQEVHHTWICGWYEHCCFCSRIFWRLRCDNHTQRPWCCCPRTGVTSKQVSIKTPDVSRNFVVRICFVTLCPSPPKQQTNNTKILKKKETPVPLYFSPWLSVGSYSGLLKIWDYEAK